MLLYDVLGEIECLQCATFRNTSLLKCMHADCIMLSFSDDSLMDTGTDDDDPPDSALEMHAIVVIILPRSTAQCLSESASTSVRYDLGLDWFISVHYYTSTVL
jgi:hypothetical protein